MNRTDITLGSFFDGIGGALLCATICGATPVWASEIEKFPIAVTKHHFPSVIHLGDITKINGEEIPSVDIAVGGSPCQDLSVAGKRQGMKHSELGDEDGTRSGLFMEQIRIIKEQRRKYGKPRFMVWENVPGALSSNNGEDFRVVLEETARVADSTVSIPRSFTGWANAGSILADGFSISWRIIDAQYWGVPQRRRRIYLVADFGGQSAPQILFEREGLPRYIAQSRESWKGTSETTKTGIRSAGFKGGQGSKAGGIGYGQETAPTVLAGQESHVVCFEPGAITRDMGVRHWEEISPTLRAEAFDNRPAICYGITPLKAKSEEMCVTETDTALTLDTNGKNPACHQGGIAICSSVGGFMQAESEKPPTLMARDYKDPHVVSQCQKQVRRLTPLECERLQGYPDGWTDIPGASDSARYKALGNSFAIPCALFVISGCVEVLAET